jgi:acyl-CoA synthetase (NDP forming)/GNAT superfamily N-acetyltransferase
MSMNTTSGTVPRGVYALLTDGTTAEIRPAVPGDMAAVQAMHEAMSPATSYLRFFSYSRLSAAEEAERVCRPPGPGHQALLALYGGEIAGVASYEVGGSGQRAEVAFAVTDRMHGRGLGTLLLEHLVSDAVQRGVTTLTASVLLDNAEMQRVFTDAGLSVERHLEDGVLEFTCALPRDDADPHWARYLDAAAARERRADVASLRHVFAPGSVAVIGASHRVGTPGRAILHNIVTGGYAGQVYAVNPHAQHMEAVPCLASVSDLPEPVDLAVVVVPPAAVSAVADECGRRGVRAIVVITAGMDTAQDADLLAICRRYGMRLVGPDCFGVAVPSIGLDATFASRHPAPGRAGLVMQSGGLGFALADRLSRLGVGVSSFVSVGNKLDVSSNDLLLWWEQDQTTKIAVLYIESFGNPRKFARTARRVGRTLPVLTVHAGQPGTGQRAAASHTIAAATPLVTQEALFRQAGIIATKDLGELVDVAALLASQPAPAGPNVAIISNVGGAGVLAAGACAQQGLTVHRLTGDTRRRLHSLIPASGAVTNPVDTTATVTEDGFRRVLEMVAADDGVDAVLALALPTAATGDLTAAIRAADVPVPLAAVLLDQAEAVQLLAHAGEAQHDDWIPAYAYPEAAAKALARAAAYGAWRARPAGHLREFGDVSAAEARTLVRDFLHRHPKGGQLPPSAVTALLACYQVHLASLVPATSADEAVRAAEGTEVIIGVVQEPVFGPLVVFGPGGVATDVLADRAARLAPLTDTDADELIRSSRSSPRLLGFRGRQPADMRALQDLLLRVSRLADDLPELAELDLNPVIARPDGVAVVDARIRLAPAEPQDPFLRRLR